MKYQREHFRVTKAISMSILTTELEYLRCAVTSVEVDIRKFAAGISEIKN